MANLAIRGHKTRGKEVIEILEMLGGKNSYNVDAIRDYCVYFIEDEIIFTFKIKQIRPNQFTIFTLEEFLEKYPYKVGDKVTIKERDKVVIITDISWRNGREIIYETIHNGDCYECFSAEELQPYKEKETMKEQIMIEDITLEKAVMCTFCEVVESKQRLRIAMNEGFKLKEENGNFFIYREKVEYPKTYGECCKLLDICPKGSIVYAGNWVYGGDYLEKHLEKIKNFQKLLICRDAYWKLEGEKLGLGKPWKPDFSTIGGVVYGLYTLKNEIAKIDSVTPVNLIIAFPNAKIRNIFYENFKDLIEQCKELL